MQSGNRVAMYYYLDQAREMTRQITDEEDRHLLLTDLESIS
jgi:hypothetical protein